MPAQFERLRISMLCIGKDHDIGLIVRDLKTRSNRPLLDVTQCLFEATVCIFEWGLGSHARENDNIISKQKDPSPTTRRNNIIDIDDEEKRSNHRSLRNPSSHRKPVRRLFSIGDAKETVGEEGFDEEPAAAP